MKDKKTQEKEVSKGLMRKVVQKSDGRYIYYYFPKRLKDG
jgi:hypothetical protein